ncbi:hypothetical protein [Poseidonocella sp. HB161398]|uniref:hypothetical protein n=1 Tax=Poseidonocella sp. HB161398 TaxID=2320855 RepID=UPI001109E473|nr:hypothetical protein [Poseidonocella sp. HB161398]
MTETTTGAGSLGREASIIGYGAALAALSLAGGTEAEAAVVPLSFDPGSLSFLPGPTYGTYVALLAEGDTVATFLQQNDNAGKSFGNNWSGTGFRQVAAGSTISTGQVFDSVIALAPDFEGTLTFGFITDADQVGWFSVSFVTGGAVTWLDGAFETTGSSILAGQSVAVPLPASLPLLGLSTLALGALGVRRMRAQKSA